MAKLECLKVAVNNPFHLILHFDRFSNFCIFQPIWTKLVPNGTNFGSRSSFLGSKMSKLQFIIAQGKIRSKFRGKTGFSGNGEFSGFTTAWYQYQGTLWVQKPLRSQIAKFDYDFYSSGTVCILLLWHLDNFIDTFWTIYWHTWHYRNPVNFWWFWLFFPYLSTSSVAFQCEIFVPCI